MKKQIIINGKSQIYTIDTSQFQRDDTDNTKVLISPLIAKMLATLGIGIILLVLVFYFAVSAFNANESNHAYPGSEISPTAYTAICEDGVSNTDVYAGNTNVTSLTDTISSNQ